MKKTILLLSVTLFLAACNSSNFKIAEPPANSSAQNYGNQNGTKSKKSNTENNKQKVIRTADIKGVVNDYEAFYKDLNLHIKSFDAYINNAEEYRSNNSIENKFEIKIPNSNFEEALIAITNKIDKVKSRKIKSTDVTAAVLDLESRLNTKTKMIVRYQDFIKQAKNIEEILKVEEHIRVLQEEVEATNAKLKYYHQQVAYSTIHLQIVKYFEQPLVAKSFGFFRKMKVAFISGWESLLTTIIGFTYAWPFWLFLSGIALFFYSILTKRKFKTQNTINSAI